MNRKTDRKKVLLVTIGDLPEPSCNSRPATCCIPRLVVVWTALGILTLATPLRLAGETKWVDQGPGPILDGQVERIGTTNPVSGGVNAIAVNPNSPDILYAGAVNGGIWKTKNGTQTSPTWEPLTDDKLPALSIKSLALSPVNPREIFGGTGSTSSFALIGDPGFGVAHSTDAGATWEVLAARTFRGRVINSIVPTTLKNGNVVLAATAESNGGVWRSADDGVSFRLISGTAELPGGGVSSLVADPTNPKFFYAALPSSTIANAGDEGVYLSMDGGLTWTHTSLTVTGSTRILLAVSQGTGAVYAMVLNGNGIGDMPGSGGTLLGVSRSGDHGTTWTNMGVPTPPIFPGGQTDTNGAIAADPLNRNVVFIAGDRQDGPFPNSNGCNNFSANVFRGDASLLPANPWECVVCSGAGRSSPHADSRTLVFDTSGNLMYGCDGGMDRLLFPNSAPARVWADLGGNIRTVEMHSVAYDPNCNVVFGGNQDVATSIEVFLGSRFWTNFLSGDGGIVAVDASAHVGTSIRYTCFNFLDGFNRSTWDAANSLVPGSMKDIGLNITAGPGTGKKLHAFDRNIQFYQPYVLNAISPTRMLIATTTIYESMDQGDSLTNLDVTNDGGFAATALAYGGRSNGVDEPDVLYVAAGTTIWHRVTLGGPIDILSAYPGSSVVALAMSPEDFTFVVVVDTSGRVWSSSDEGATWENITDNLGNLTPDVRAVVVLVDKNNKTRILVAGQNGVFDSTDTAGATWANLRPGLPHALFWDLHFNDTNDVLVASSIGRGAWTLSGVFKGGTALATVSPVRTINTPLWLPALPSHPPIAAPPQK